MTELQWFVFLSKIPIYIYVIHRAYRFRHSLLIISSQWLGALAFFGALSSFSVLRTSKFLAGLIAYGVVLSLFMLTYTAKELKRVKDKK